MANKKYNEFPTSSVDAAQLLLQGSATDGTLSSFTAQELLYNPVDTPSTQPGTINSSQYQVYYRSVDTTVTALTSSPFLETLPFGTGVFTTSINGAVISPSAYCDLASAGQIILDPTNLFGFGADAVLFFVNATNIARLGNDSVLINYRVELLLPA